MEIDEKLADKAAIMIEELGINGDHTIDVNGGVMYLHDIMASFLQIELKNHGVSHHVMLSELLEDAENKATEIDDGKSDRSLGYSQGFESGAAWVIEQIKERTHSA